MRSFLGIILGIIVGVAMQSAVDLIANYFYPAAITDMWDRRQVAEAMAARPTGALLFSVLGYFLGGLAGAWVARLIARTGRVVWVPAGALAVMALIIAFSFPLPAWSLFATFAAPLFGGMIARHLGSDPEPAAPVPATADAPPPGPATDA